ncbi:MAG: NADH-quinone oxidoreductase subunit L [Caldilineaceae bacterium]
MFDLAWLLFILPAVGVLINLFLGDRMEKLLIGLIASVAVGMSFVIGVMLFVNLLTLPVDARSVTVHLWDWITVGTFSVGASLLLDPLSLTMVLVVTGVGTLIHIYSIAYMEDDERFQRYFIYLNFFIFAMLILVLSDNFLGMFVGWEGVGLASFLLIGFWFDRKDDMYGWYADAGKKAFLVNRIGDFGMIVAMAMIWTTVGTLNFIGVNDAAHHQEFTTAAVNVVCLLLLLGATGKSAQIPLYVWLPDAMAGPTPVSALIHAATMVTAGIYMIARTHGLWYEAAFASMTAATIGALTAFFAASIALVQTDLKKILAYSTISQLGYMLLGVGVGVYGAAIFHLTTHAFFKALLFLAAGSVMHATHGVLDIRRLGGMRDKMPTTSWTFLIGAAALAGLIPFSGFFSKDAILLGALAKAPLLYIIGLAAALMTAFYSFRMFFVTFMGKPRDRELYDHLHESPPLMTVPLWILAGLAIIAGVVNLPFVLSMEKFLEPALGAHDAPSLTLEMLALLLSLVVGLFGIVMAYSRYRTQENWVTRMAAPFKPLEPWLQNAYYVDEFYMRFIVNPLRRAATWMADVFDKKIIDGLVNGIGSVTMDLGGWTRSLQNGRIPTYALSLFIGVVAVVIYFIFIG